MNSHPLTQDQIDRLTRQGCRSETWSAVTAAPDIDLSRIHNATFIGRVALGSTAGTVQVGGATLPAGIYDATIAECIVGAGVRIAAVHTVLSGYDIGDGACVQDVGLMTAQAGSRFGNGVSVDAINEAGGRALLIHSRLTAQTAYMEAVHRHDRQFTAALRKITADSVASSTPKRATVGAGASVIGCRSIRNVVIGPAAVVDGAADLRDGTIDSCPEHPTQMGAGVVAREFVVSEGARIDSGAILDRVFVGQGVTMGRHYSAGNSVFFANCELYHGEGVAVFAGPHTVTHHKSTLMIAGLFSFFNAGSGTNQSNHMYKLGPVHQGVFERGCKTGSFAYLLYEAHVGAFSSIIGKHLAPLRTPQFPFSYIIERGGESTIMPAIGLLSVGTVRDGEKWPKRDARKAKEKRDLINFDVFSPYTVEKMRRGRDELLALQEGTPQDLSSVKIGGLQMPRGFLSHGAKHYADAVARYLVDHVARRVADALQGGIPWAKAMASLAPVTRLRKADEWTDIAGLLAPTEVVRDLEANVSRGTCASYDELLSSLAAIHAAYPEYAWQYVAETFGKEFGHPLQTITKAEFMGVLDAGQKAALSLQSAVLADAKKEFGPSAHIGFGVDLADSDGELEFEAVRGRMEDHEVMLNIARGSNEITARYETLRAAIQAAP